MFKSTILLISESYQKSYIPALLQLKAVRRTSDRSYDYNYAGERYAFIDSEWINELRIPDKYRRGDSHQMVALHFIELTMVILQHLCSVAEKSSDPFIHSPLDYLSPNMVIFVQDITPMIEPLLGDKGAIPDEELSPAEQLFLKAIRIANQDIFVSKGVRDILIGSSGRAQAWTDGIKHIYLNQKLLQEIIKNNSNYLHKEDFIYLGYVLMHEYSHKDESLETMDHSFEFYKHFHDSCLDAGEHIQTKTEYGDRQSGRARTTLISAFSEHCIKVLEKLRIKEKNAELKKSAPLSFKNLLQRSRTPFEKGLIKSMVAFEFLSTPLDVRLENHWSAESN